ncbi:tRNA pseudouridine(38-40) synthase TruA [Myroides sp. LJL116]
MRYFLEFAYDGTAYHGWQIQPNAITVQQTLTHAISTLLKQPIELVGAGRTDSGVHAKQMFAHFDYPLDFDKEKLISKMNSFLPSDIVIYSITQVQDQAHARFDATARTYQYHIHTHKDAFCNAFSYYFYKKLDIDKMNQAAQLLLDYEDFECFSKTNSDVFTFNCTIEKAYWEKTSDNKIVFTIKANRFLRNMVRAIVGTLLEVGTGKIPVEHIHSIIESKDRSKAGFSVPGKALFLTKVSYPYL